MAVRGGGGHKKKKKKKKKKNMAKIGLVALWTTLKHLCLEAIMYS